MRSLSKTILKSKTKKRKRKFSFWRDLIKQRASFLFFTLLSVSLIGFLTVILVLFAPARAGDNALLTSGVCSIAPVNSTSFIKTYHLRDATEGFGVFITKDGGYLLTGDTTAGGGMAAPYPYIVKADAKGNKSWSKDFSSASNALGELSSRHVGRLAVETTDGNIITAADVVDFVNEDLKEFYGDILVTKLNKNGARLWSIMFGDHSLDRPRQVWALPDGGVLLMARFLKTGYGSEITDGVPGYSVFIKIDKNGKVQSSKKMDWDAISADRLVDGSLIVLAEVAVILPKPAENIVGPEVVMHPLPTMIKLDNNFNVVWAKSLEMIPTEMNSPTSYTGGVMTIGKTIIREAGGDFRVIQAAPDGGFVAFGYSNLMLTQGFTSGAGYNISDLEYSLRPFVAVKVDVNGNYQWTKKLTVNLVSGGSANDFHVTRTTDGNFVIMKDVVRDSDGVAAKSHDASVKRMVFLDKCREDKNASCNLEENLPPELQSLVEATDKALGVLAEASAVNIGLIKTDANFNPLWIKQYSVERGVSGYGLAPTADKGVAAVGTMLTTKMHSVMGTMEPYKETALIKVNANGEANGCAAVIDHAGSATVEDQSGFLVMQNMKVGESEDLKLKINKKVPEKVSTAKGVARDICKYQKNSVSPVCSSAAPNTALSTPSGQSATPPVAGTWAAINYNNTKEAVVSGEKNKIVHEELLPILNQVYNNQVKMKDSMTSMWLAYVFPRPATRADVETVQKYLEGLGYKVTDSEGGDLWVSKIGLTLHFEFSIQDSMNGKLEVRF